MTWDIGLANMFNTIKDDRTGILGSSIGEVISIAPLKISMNNGAIILDSNIHDIYICDNLVSKEYKFNLSGEGGDIAITSTHSNPLISINMNNKENNKLELFFEFNNGDNVMLVPDESGQAFFIVDKIRKAGG